MVVYVMQPYQQRKSYAIVQCNILVILVNVSAN